MNNENSDSNLSEIGEDENDVDIMEDDELGEEEPNEIPRNINYFPWGEEILKEFVI